MDNKRQQIYASLAILILTVFLVVFILYRNNYFD